MKIRIVARVILIFLCGLFVLVTASMGMVLVQTFREYENVKVNEKRAEQKLDMTRKEFSHKDKYLNLLLSDEAFLDHVVREKLGYAREDELILRFEPKEF